MSISLDNKVGVISEVDYLIDIVNGEKFQLTHLVDILTVFSNDVKTAHWNIVGKDFLGVHIELGDLYDFLTESIDKIAEMGKAQNEIINNPSTAIIRVQDWESIEIDDSDTNEIISYVINNGNIALDCLKCNWDYEPFIKSELDTIIAEIDKIINYKFKQILK